MPEAGSCPTVGSAIRRPSLIELTTSGGLICLLLTLAMSDGGRTSFARAMLAAGVFSLISVVLISRENLVYLKGLPLPWLGLVALLIMFSFFTSIFRDFSLKEALTLLAVIGASTLGFHAAGQGRHRPLLIALLASGVFASLLAAPPYLSAPAGSQAASALSGSFNYPNGLGSFLLLMCLLPFPFLFHGETLFASLASILVPAVLWAALILTYSRGVWAAGLIALLSWAALEWKLIWAHRRRMVLAAVLGVSLVSVVSRRPADIAPHFASLAAAPSNKSRDPSFQWRHDVYAWTLDIIKDHPWTGTGIGTFPITIKQYQRAPYVTGLYAHNHYLQTAAEMGLPALAWLLLFLGFLFRRGWRIIGSFQSGSFERSLAVGLAAGLLGSSLHAAVDLGWSYPAVALAFGVEAAILFGLAAQPLPATERAAPGPGGPRASRFVLLSLCLVMAVLAGTRYYSEILRNVGKLALEEGDRDQAVAALRWASRLNPFFYSPRQLLASAYAAQGDVGSSQREAEAAFRLDPLDGDAYHALAKTHWLAGERKKAESEFLSAVRLQPYTRPAFYYDLAELYLAIGAPNEALAWLTRGIEIFKPEIVTSRASRCLAPGDRYILARMYWRLAEIWRAGGRVPDGKGVAELAVQLAKPDTSEICFRAMKGRFLSPESTIVTYWDSRSRRDLPGVMATFATDAGQRFKDESLMGLRADIERVEVDWIVSLVGNEEAVQVGYEVKLSFRAGRARMAAFTDNLVVERGGWHLRQRAIGLN